MRRLSTAPVVWMGWVLARLLLVWMVIGTTAAVGDVHYYHAGLFGDDPSDLTEYPDAGVWPLRLLALFTGADLDRFVIGFVVLCLLVDAVFLALVLHWGGGRRFTAAWFWVAFGTAAGPVFVLRLDLYPAVLVAAFATLLFRHPRWASAALALATTMKLWPGVLAAGLVGGWRRAGTWIRVGWFTVALALLCLVTVLTSGADRLLSPLTYQEVRGLQVESLTATPFIVAAHLNPEEWRIAYSSSKSFEVSGAGTAGAVAVTDWLMIAVLVFAVAWALRSLILHRWRPRTAIAFALLMVALLIVTNKVFSPQYIVWLGPLLAVCLCLTDSRLVRAMTWLTVLAAALGTVLFPFLYDSLVHDVQDAGAAVVVLAVRNVLVVVICVLAATWLWREDRALDTRRDEGACTRAQVRTGAAQEAGG
ncbi:hypothetical protein [Corynebacterium halotolerans]|uniref:Integral membrane protein n=1 Tax=Corynebacterium halotolerans YIM 70093 = DSM 44683 TaxID=1121362 RepID=M1P7J8_9CORY|nr:hypothetical protein [Corynebacterium halotolerans]AGF72626.1 hypothetical protein A605_08120 [Corynebacterium halotolerans YIM 70093 = DSM 44683]